MSKKEMIYPLNTTGGRIQNRRRLLHMSRVQLYDSVCPSDAVANASKSRTVKNWECGKCEPPRDIFIQICLSLHCSADYLLGLDECANKTSQFIHDETGLPESSIDALKILKKYENAFPGSQEEKYTAIDLLLQNDRYQSGSLSSLLEILVAYFRFNIPTDGKVMYTVDKDGVKPFGGNSIMGADGKRIGCSYNPMQAHFSLADMESVFRLRIMDSVRELKEEYQKQK